MRFYNIYDNDSNNINAIRIATIVTPIFIQSIVIHITPKTNNVPIICKNIYNTVFILIL